MDSAPIRAGGPEISGSQKLGLLLACLTGFAFSINYTNHAPLISALTRTFHFSLALAGLLTTAIFTTHAATQIPGGYLADTLGSKRVLCASMALVCAGNFGIAFAGSYWHLVFWKAFVGVGTGVSFVSGARYIAATFQGRVLHFAQGLYGGSILLGAGFVIYGVPRFAASFGWRGAFMTTACAAVLAWLFWFMAPEPPAITARAAAGFGGMVVHPQLWLLGAVQMASFGLTIVVSTWITVFLRDIVGLNAARAGTLGSGALLLGIVMRPVGGVLAQRTGIRPLLQLSLILGAAGCLILAIGGGEGWAILSIFLIGVGGGLPYSALFTRAAALFADRAGAAMGLVNMLGIIMILAAPPLIGRLVDTTGSFQSSFAALGCFSLLVFLGTFGIDRT